MNVLKNTQRNKVLMSGVFVYVWFFLSFPLNISPIFASLILLSHPEILQFHCYMRKCVIE